MKPGSDSKGLLTVGKDNRVTATGSFLRKSKLDELPQLFNVLAGEMSLVGTRPEVKKYVDTYSEEQKKVLMVRPGLTDYASLQYICESDLLGESENPEKTYLDEILPAKIALNLQYINERKPCKDTRILMRTFFKIIGF
jgi:lipopolysaccharide/colanic/teichoic acid biosynthesis glycosyltransferase